MYDPEYLPTDKDIYVEFQDLERAKELMLKEREEQPQEKPSEEDDMPRGKRMLIQSLSVIAFMRSSFWSCSARISSQIS